MSEQFTLPDVGEGLTEAEIVTWRVAPGDHVEINQSVVEIETAKSVVELPVPFAGVVRELHAAVGDVVELGQPLLSIDGEPAVRGGGEESPESPAGVKQDHPERTLSPSAHADTTTAPPNLVGYGASERPKSRRRGRTSAAPAAGVPAAGAPSTGASAAGTPVGPARPIGSDAARQEAEATQQPRAHGIPVIARPPIRKLAKDLGVRLSEVPGSGDNGEVTRQDVIDHAQQASVFRNIETPEWPAEREQVVPVVPAGREEVVKVHGVRRSIARAMTSSAFTAPHVTVFVDVDATRTMEYVKRLKSSPSFAGVKVSPLLIMARAVIWAAQRSPEVNSSFDEEQITIHHYVNLGIAAATPRGLLVPNIKEAQRLSLRELAQALTDLTATARAGRTQPAEMSGGTITITNIGVFGMDAGTPILNPGEVAIVAMGAIRQKPWVVDGEVRPRYVTTVSASFDHRVVDGDVASRFTADVASVLEEPALLLDE